MKKRMKKLAALALAACMFASITACGSNEQATKEETVKEETVSVVSEVNTESVAGIENEDTEADKQTEVEAESEVEVKEEAETEDNESKEEEKIEVAEQQVKAEQKVSEAAEAAKKIFAKYNIDIYQPQDIEKCLTAFFENDTKTLDEMDKTIFFICEDVFEEIKDLISSDDLDTFLKKTF